MQGAHLELSGERRGQPTLVVPVQGVSSLNLGAGSSLSGSSSRWKAKQKGFGPLSPPKMCKVAISSQVKVPFILQGLEASHPSSPAPHLPVSTGACGRSGRPSRAGAWPCRGFPGSQTWRQSLWLPPAGRPCLREAASPMPGSREKGDSRHEAREFISKESQRRFLTWGNALLQQQKTTRAFETNTLF